jgi:hypothetical protein
VSSRTTPARCVKKQVVHTETSMLQLASCVEARGWGRGLRCAGTQISAHGRVPHLVVVVQPDDGCNAAILRLVPPLRAAGVGEHVQAVAADLEDEDSNTCGVEDRLVRVVHQHRLPARPRAAAIHELGPKGAHGEIRSRDSGRQLYRDPTVEGWRRRRHASGRHRPAQQRKRVNPRSRCGGGQPQDVEAAALFPISVQRGAFLRRRLAHGACYGAVCRTVQVCSERADSRCLPLRRASVS